MSFLVRNRRSSPERLLAKNPGALLVDVTSRGPEPWVRFSPFFPHGGIPVPFTPGVTGASVEGIWQGLKVFENADVDLATLQNVSMARLKRTTRRFGRVLGHRKGLHGQELLPYAEARQSIYLPTYGWVLENRLKVELEKLRELERKGSSLILLDYETNVDIENFEKPLSHAGLIVRYLDGS